MRARSIRFVPVRVLALLVFAFAAQVAWHALSPAPAARARDLPAPPAVDVLRLAALGDPIAGSRLVMLWLQAFDNQPGVSIPFASLDYTTVKAWLDVILGLDPRSEYPLLAAARVYGNVADPGRKRTMYDYLHEKFLEDPNRRWRWLAHAAIDSKHGLEDLDRALTYARSITEHATGPGVPAWARDMSVVILEDMGEYEAALFLAYRLLEEGRVTDPNEIRFLAGKLEALEARIGDKP